ncbi:PQQ-dependent sugar dehydrogenase [Chryseobacterium sp. S0630]|uniref:PQQ-dependent sugar dehydrogenase n=1 Tax=Chryseobacterium sp. S0630 TaxID=2957803 RepID=UPI00209F6797|nr:PQQ-dependent sugar dehydrogenase [Chryseobacterium sp. S0630]MCP1299628.1 PQQ-dependent sugar dehydrogenase [Chryseobacterium sp. S0630]
MKKIMFLSLFLAGLCDVYSQNFQLQPYKSGFDLPVGVVFDPSGNAFVWEKGGKVKQIAPNGGNISTVIDISGEVMSPDLADHGLLGFALDPQFAVNGYIYLWYTVEPRILFPNVNTNDQLSPTIGRCTRYTYKNGVLDYNSRKILVGAPKVVNGKYDYSDGPLIFASTHGVGSAFFGADGNLMLSIGDGNLALDSSIETTPDGKLAIERGIITQAELKLQPMRAQSKTSLSGKILRINKDTGDGIPGNPYYDSSQPRSAQSRVAVMGVRNPYRVTPLTQNVLGGGPGQFLVSDTGENAWEEAALYSMGDNGGWPHYEGFDNARISEQFTTFPKDPSYTFKFPLYSWPHKDNANKGWGGDSKINQNGNAVLWYNLSSDSYNHQGTSSTGNTFYPKDIIADRYNGALTNTVLAADYVGYELMGIKFNENGTNANFSSPAKVYKVINAGGIVHLYTNPYDGYIYTVNYSNGGVSNSISRLEITGNYTPTALIKSDKTFIKQGESTVQFYGGLSYDKETQNLQYLWNFGDGTTSTEVNPVRTFTIPNSAPGKRVVTLTVTDAGGATNIATKEIYLNNNAPVIQDVVVKRSSDNTIVQTLPNTHPSSTNVDISVAATDDLTSAANLTYTMQVNRHHDDHIHYGSIIYGSTTNTTFVPEGGCGEGATYWFEVLVKVKDADGAETEFSKQIFQTCNGLQNQTITVQNPPAFLNKNSASFNLSAYASSGLPISFRRISGPINVDNSGKITFTGESGAARIILLQAGGISGSTNYGNANPVYVDFEVNDAAQASANFTDPTAICTDVSSKVVNTSTGGTLNSYKWELFDTNGQVVSTSTNKDYDLKVPDNSTSNSFYIKLTATNPYFGQSSSIKYSAWLNKKICDPTVTPVANFTEPTTLCTNRNNTIINTSAGGAATTYEWTVQEGNQYYNILTNTNKDFVFTLPNYAAGYYKVSLKATNSLGTNTKTSGWIPKSQCTTTARMGNNAKAISAPNGDKPELPVDSDLVYPNPTSSSVNFSYSAIKNYTEYSIYDMAGRELKKGPIQDATVDISKYPNGTYTIVFSNASTKERATKKIIKK